jgi:SAM-dependent methyltransferase
MPEYSLSSVDVATRARLAHLAEIFDPLTFARLDGLGVAAGWRCAEIGAATGTVAEWLAHRVGPSGHVVATDIDTRWLESLAGANLEVRHHDISREPLEQDSYDLIHARAVLAHVGDWRAALARMAEAIRPGGWLFVEDADWVTSGLSYPDAPGTADFWTAIGRLIESAGGDCHVGRQLLEAFHHLHLIDIGAESGTHVNRADHARQLDLLGPTLVAMGRLAVGQLDAARAELATPGITYFPMGVLVWGRRRQS